MADRFIPCGELLHQRNWVEKFLRWEQLRARLRNLAEDRRQALREGDRGARRLPVIDRAMAEIRAELVKLQPADRYMLSEANVIIDRWLELVTHWRGVQEECSVPVGPDEIPLAECHQAHVARLWSLLIGKAK